MLHVRAIWVQLNIVFFIFIFYPRYSQKSVSLVCGGRCVDFQKSESQSEIPYWSQGDFFFFFCCNESWFCWVVSSQWRSSKRIGRCRAEWTGWGVRFDHVKVKVTIHQLVSCDIFVELKRKAVSTCPQLCLTGDFISIFISTAMLNFDLSMNESWSNSVQHRLMEVVTLYQKGPLEDKSNAAISLSSFEVIMLSKIN